MGGKVGGRNNTFSGMLRLRHSRDMKAEMCSRQLDAIVWNPKERGYKSEVHQHVDDI